MKPVALLEMSASVVSMSSRQNSNTPDPTPELKSKHLEVSLPAISRAFTVELSLASPNQAALNDQLKVFSQV